MMEIKQASLEDVPGIAELVDRFARNGEILPRRIEDIYQTVREWVVAKEDGQIVGCGSLVVLWADMAEIRSMVVVPEVQGKGVGRRMMAVLLVQAAQMELPQVIALTRKPGFFVKLGFHTVARESLPRKMWKDCVYCTKFVGCDEVAMVRPVYIPAEEQERPVPALIGAASQGPHHDAKSFLVTLGPGI
jgi:amino-acid N-acetyltransferase